VKITAGAFLVLNMGMALSLSLLVDDIAGGHSDHA
jgi:hypothetical protein